MKECARDTTSYIMLNNYCVNNTKTPLGVTAAAATYAPYGANPKLQSIPVFMGADYNKAPYQSGKNEQGLLFCGSCNGNYCPSKLAYNWPTDANSNSLSDPVYNAEGKLISGYQPVHYVSRGPDATINQQCANMTNSGSVCAMPSFAVNQPR